MRTRRKPLMAIFNACVQYDSSFSLWPLTDATYQIWRAHAQNAKFRRKWKRRDIPNSQRQHS